LTYASEVEFAVNFFVALFALIDPVGNVPLFAAATVGASAAGRRLTTLYIALFAFAFLAFFYVTGLSLLRFFGISLPAFRIAGGILLLLLGLDMARGDITDTFGAGDADMAALSTRAYAAKRFGGLVVPFGMPLLIGPGAISSAVIYAEEARRYGLGGVAVGVAVIAAVAFTIILAFWFSTLISRILGKIGMVVVVRVLGLILCAMAVQFVLAGLADSTIGLVKRGAAAPYQGVRRSDLSASPARDQGHRPIVGDDSHQGRYRLVLGPRHADRTIGLPGLVAGGGDLVGSLP
jgi:multiple antibiotic resistance protein